MSDKSSLAALSIPGGWEQRTVSIGSHEFKLLVPADPDAFLNHLEPPGPAAPSHLADPYWAKLWPAAEHLAATLLRMQVEGRKSKVESCGQFTNSPDLRRSTFDIGLPVLELGCGSGLVGLAGLAAGLEVTFSDYVSTAVDLALENARRNGFARAQGLVLDWRKPIDRQWPLIVASDVTYDRANLPLLLNVLDRMLAAGGQAWFGDAGRGPAADFLHLASDRGWSVDLYDEHDQPAPAPGLGRYQRIVLRRVDD